MSKVRDPAKDARVDELARRGGLRKAQGLRVWNSQVYARAGLVEVFIQEPWLRERRYVFRPTAAQLMSIVNRAAWLAWQVLAKHKRKDRERDTGSGEISGVMCS